MRRLVPIIALGLLAFLPGCSGGKSKPRLNAGGATFIFPMMSTWTSEYDKAKGVEINYQSIGSGGGIQQMTAQTFDFGCSDGPMNQEQLDKAKTKGGDVIHVPLVMGAVVPAYSLKDVAEPLRFTGPLLADIFLGKVKKWNDPAIKEANPGVDLPDLEIAVVHRSDGSGTTYIWADYLAKVSKEWKEKVGVGTSVNWPVGVGQKGNEAVARQTKQTEGAIGYIELTYALQNDIAYGLVKNKAGVFVKPSLESVTAAANSAVTDIPDDLRYSITDAPGKDSYPVSGTSWAVLYTKQGAERGPHVKDFLHWATHEGQKHCHALHYATLPEGLVKRIEKKLELVTVGK
ncbi:MAG: phosphate ABC transporter substrate-binding protein PstS [Gemmataceae bacterium]|nr:phosphate ABC transporter substrate-binding protein PstS [Gemmataceae bacterium]